MSAIQKLRLSDDNRIFTLEGALSPAECDGFIRRAEESGFGDAPVTVGFNKFRMIPDFRNNTRVIADDADLAAFLWSRVASHVPDGLGDYQPVGLNERFRYYRYDVGQQFDWHRDGAFVRSPSEQSLLTVLFYLNEGFEGGTTDFMDEELIVAPRRGMALFFSHPLLHRGAPVTKGIKYVLRTDVMYSRA
jgi:prolyl 4-hydroxylase